jgi:hypothetical protein
MQSSFRITLRCYGELNDYLHPLHRGRSFSVLHRHPATVKAVIESLGVPAAETDLILVNGEPVDPSYLIRADDRISVYPAFRTLDISSVEKSGGGSS